MQLSLRVIRWFYRSCRFRFISLPHGRLNLFIFRLRIRGCLRWKRGWNLRLQFFRFFRFTFWRFRFQIKPCHLRRQLLIRFRFRWFGLRIWSSWRQLQLIIRQLLQRKISRRIGGSLILIRLWRINHQQSFQRRIWLFRWIFRLFSFRS